jgi:hypothetical protein
LEKGDKGGFKSLSISLYERERFNLRGSDFSDSDWDLGI